ncbi:Arm DNA-binding domain-containing protein [Erythrobacter sp. HA6-11]
MSNVAKECQRMSANTCSDTDTVRTQPNRKRLSDRVVSALKAPQSGSTIVYDTSLSGFGIRLTKAGSKAFILNYRFEGRERRITIGKFPT